MSAHSCQFQCVTIGQAVGLAEKTERILDAVTLQTGAAGEVTGLVESAADVDGKAEVGLLEVFDEGDNVVGIVEDRRDGGGRGHAVDDGVNVESVLAMPVDGGVEVV